VNRPRRLFSKNTGLCEAVRRSIGADACPVSGYILYLTVLHSPVFLLNSRLGLFTAASLARKHPFSRSYRVSLPSSLATDHSSTSGYSPWPPVSVSGTGRHILNANEVFLGRITTPYRRPRRFAVLSPIRPPRRICLPGLLCFRLQRTFHLCAWCTLLRHPMPNMAGIGILTNFPSASPRGLSLGPD